MRHMLSPKTRLATLVIVLMSGINESSLCLQLSDDTYIETYIYLSV